ncbi:MAG: UvrD-helicase domain-containing protein [Armatimonadota bacterium]|jgi:ATP-dependent helicase/nuclease subunit A
MSDAATRERIERRHAEIAKDVRDLSRSWIMTSGAGCGKTYQMVQRYVAIIEQGTEVSSIIAVTFTEKAAAELKDRVRQECRARMSDPARDEADRRRFETAARQLAMAPVSTIHGLCARLLRENAIAAGVDPHFTQLDAMGQAMLLREVLRETLLARLHRGEQSARMCVERWGLGGAADVLRGLIDDRESLADLLADPPGGDELLARWEAEFERVYAPMLSELTSCEHWAEATACLLAVEPCDRDDAAAERHRAARGAHEVVSDQTQPLSARAAAFGECLSLAHKGHVGRKDNWSDRPEDHQTIKDGLRALGELRDACREQKIAFPELEDAATARVGAAVLREASAAASAYDEAKRERSALDFADLQILARDLLVEHPEVLERMQRRYRHVLVDEFQDTNALQKEIIWRIAGGDAETGAPPPGGGLFVVGDAKQSIYGFRNADVRVFNRTARDFTTHEAAGPIPLETTRRSRPRLVAFFNDLFERPEVMGCEQGADYEAHYQPVNAFRDPHPMGAEVELILIPKDELAEEAAEGGETESVGIRVARQREAEVLAARIREIVEGGEPQVPDGDGGAARPPRYADFGMLFQATTDIGVYEYALRRAGVPFYAVAGRGFYNRQEIRDCLSLLQVLENAANEVALVGALRSPIFGLSDDTIFFLTRERRPLMVALGHAAEGAHPAQERIAEEQHARIRHARETIGRLRALRDRVGLSELIERMLAETGLGAVELTQFAGRQSAANLAKLTDLARSFEQRGAFSLREFITYLGELVLQEPREGLADVFEEGADVVKLMTVHGAKGLEWPIVVVPDLGRSLPVSRDQVRVSPALGVVPPMESEDGGTRWGAVGESLRATEALHDEAERRRLLYVALTRARDMLILSSALEFAGSEDDRRLSAGYWLTWLTKGLGLDCTVVEDRQEIRGGDWCARVSVPSAEATESEGRRLGEGRADLSILREATARDAAPLPDRVLAVELAAVPPDHLSVSALQCYRVCPRRFYLRHVLGLAEAPGDGDWLHGLSAVRRGDVAHRVLEIVGRGGLDDGAIATALDEAIGSGALAIRVTDHERRGIERAVRWFIEDATLDDDAPIYHDWIARAGRLRAEVQFTAPLAGAQIEGTIDALAEDSRGAWRILDYKTGKPTQQARDAYRFQVGLYCAAVREVAGSIPVDAAIVLLDAAKVVRVEPEEAAAQALEEAERVIEAVGRGAFPCADACAGDACRLAYACQLT